MCADWGSRINIPWEDGTSVISKLLLAGLAGCFGAASLLAAQPSTWDSFVAVNLLAAFGVVVLWRRGDVSVGAVLAFALIFRLFYLWLPPVLSDDVYRYIWDGLVQVRGINPFAHAPEDLGALHDEPVYGALNSAAYYTVYPPLSQLLFRIGGWFYDGDWRASYYVIKSVLAASEAGALFLLARSVPARSLMLYAWNPLVVLAAAGQAHTESLAILCLVGAWLLSSRRRGGWSSVALAGAGLVKLYPFVLYPLLWRRFGWKSVWPGALVAAAACIPYYHPDAVANVLSSLDLYVRSFEFNAGIYYAVKKLFSLATGEDWSKQIGPAFRWLFLLLLPVVYVLDWRRRWSFRHAAVVVLGLFFALSTTIHPWYFLPLLALVVPAKNPSWHWYWLGLASIGTYLLYAEGPYWPWVIVGWSGWAVLGFVRYADPMLALLMKSRARQKAGLVTAYVPAPGRPAILDLGAGEGYVGREVARRVDGDVSLADIRDLNRTNLPLTLYDGKRLPFEDHTFDAVLLVYVLHHAADPDQLVEEARRVCRGRIIVVESIYVNALQYRILSALDRASNHIRSAGAMNARKEVLHFNTFAAWQERFVAMGLRIEVARDLGGFLHRRALYVLAP